MNVQQAYNTWAEQYDTNDNRTRDLEAIALREILSAISFHECLEIGCGTGKNTEWLVTRAEQIISVDLSENMLAKAREKISSEKVQFIKADILQPWQFAAKQFDLITFSLMLEHIENIEEIFSKATAVLKPGGHIYVGELHPFKQYSGSKARFETENGQQIVTCFNHHVSDFTVSAANHGCEIKLLKEYFDENNRENLPRILALLFQKKV